MNIICGIYKVTNIINNKIYIGQSVNIYDRWIKHQSPSHNNDGTAFHNALIKYGVNNFIWEIIEVCKQEELNQKEKYWIEYYNSYEKGYNETRGGDGIIKYDYKQIYQLWLSGLNCKEIANELKCDDSVITRALASYDLTEEELRSRSQQKRKIVAIDIKTGKGLKIFDSLRAAWLYFNPSIIGIGHLNKKQSSKDIYRGLGSIDLIAAARSVLQIDIDEEYPQYRIVRHIKSSLAPKGPSFGFQIDSHSNLHWTILDPDDKEPHLDLPDELTSMGKQEQICSLLKGALSHGPARATEIQSLMQNCEGP